MLWWMQGSEMVVFERFMNFRKTGGNHCQLNVIPVPASASAGAKAAVQKTASFHGFDLQAVPGASKVGALLCSSISTLQLLLACQIIVVMHAA